MLGNASVEKPPRQSQMQWLVTPQLKNPPVSHKIQWLTKNSCCATYRSTPLKLRNIPKIEDWVLKTERLNIENWRLKSGNLVIEKWKLKMKDERWKHGRMVRHSRVKRLENICCWGFFLLLGYILDVLKVQIARWRLVTGGSGIRDWIRGWSAPRL